DYYCQVWDVNNAHDVF
nr:immunoglobulin light chain junction region [Macaca mulatta]